VCNIGNAFDDDPLKGTADSRAIRLSKFSTGGIKTARNKILGIERSSSFA
jgi:hypothetical protein